MLNSADVSERSEDAVAGTASCCCLLIFSAGLPFIIILLSLVLSESSLMGLSFLLACQENSITDLGNTNAYHSYCNSR